MPAPVSGLLAHSLEQGNPGWPHIRQGNPSVWLTGTREMQGFWEGKASASWVGSLKEVEASRVRRVP